MYRPPQNSNRVNLIRKKFENVEKNKSPERKTVSTRNRSYLIEKNESPERRATSPRDRSSLMSPKLKKISCAVEEITPNGKHRLQRQISDPSRRNIKRTPAFRVERSVDRTGGSQRNGFNPDPSTLYETKVKQFSAVKNNCDSNSNFLSKEKSEHKPLLDNTKNVPFLSKSKSALDFNYVKSKFSEEITNDVCCNNCHDSTNSKTDKSFDLSLLYTEPIPKALRRNNSTCKDSSYSPSPVSSETGKSSFHSSPVATNKLRSIYSQSTLKIDDQERDTKKNNSLTDTLKLALSKPLPKGPAPKKPPRAFQITKNDSDILENDNFFLNDKASDKKPLIHPKARSSLQKSDPKYMLIKLEDALRNNRLRARKSPKTDLALNSGEDSDDGILTRTKSNRTLPRLPSQESDSDCNTSAFNFNCLNGFKFALTNYEKIKEPNSCFFVGSPKQEPVYAEPFHYRKDSLESALIRRESSARSKQSARNSLYYMSTPLLTAGGKFIHNMTESPDKQISAENSSLSSFTSDADTASPTEETPNIRSIIECYESKNSPSLQNGHPNANRVEDLKNSLKQTLDNSFNNICAIKDTDSENESKVSDIIKKFETYRQTMPKYCSVKIGKEKLFYCCLIIERVNDLARIKFKYPSTAEIPQSIEILCFPESNSLCLDMSNQTQNYSLLITNDKGERTFGYCRRVLPEGSTCCLPLAYCILSKYRAPRFYKKILVELESRHGLPDKYRDELISQFHNQKFPKPGDSIRINLTNIEPNIYKTDKENSIKENLEESVELVSYVHVNRTGEYIGINKHKGNAEQIFVNQNDIKKNCSVPSYIVQTKEKNELILTLHPDTRFEDSDLKKLHQLPSDILLKIFSSMLLERKVILISSIISKLSSCIDSLQSILYPFTWHHTCIPILPEALWDIVESPTPVICGVMSNDVLEGFQIENGIVVDLDSGTVKKEEGDENKILAGNMQKVWKRSLALANRAASSMEYVHSVYLSDAYLQVFVLCFKDYKKYFKDGVFQKEEFLKNGKTKGIKRFLKMFTETYMFLAFIDTVLNTPENLVEFDKKIEMYGSDDSNVILDKLLEWNR